MTLALSIAALLLGPLIYAAGRKNRIARRICDALIVVTIAVIILVHIIPDAFFKAGMSAIAILVLGIAFPVLLERIFRRAADAAHLAIVIIAIVGLLLHAVIDGLALLPENGSALAYAIVLHRLPVGMAIWWAVKPNLGTLPAVAIFSLIIAATVAGYFVGDHIVPLVETKTMALFQAFVAGSLIHVVAFGVKHHDH